MNLRKEIENISKQIQQFTDKNRGEIVELLEYDEWGVAIETLCSIIIEEDIVISKELYNSIINTGEIMEMDLSDWGELIQQVR